MLWRTPLLGAGYTNRAGVMAASLLPGAGASAPVEMSPAADNFENNLLGVAVGSDGSGFVAIYPEAAASGGAISFMYRTSADGVTWSAPAAVETNVTASIRAPQVVGNASGYLLLTPTSSSSASRRILSGGTLGPALGGAYGSIAASATEFAFIEQEGSAPKAYVYKAGAWDTGFACTRGNSESRMMIAGNASGFRVASGNSTHVYDGSSWSAAQALGQRHINNLVGVGNEYAVALTDDPWTTTPLVFAARTSGGTLPTTTTLGAGAYEFQDRDIAVAATPAGNWALWALPDAVTGVEVVVVKGF